ncbi:MAG: hypothetical protein WCV59_02810 [Parcubacteria group bacterium]|jgi:hypothetical protein
MARIKKPSWSQSRQVCKLLQNDEASTKRRPRDIRHTNCQVVVGGCGKVLAYAGCFVEDECCLLDFFVFHKELDREKMWILLYHRLTNSTDIPKKVPLKNGIISLGK